ncbi:MAG: PEGA domain-containing protein [Polyangiales bacterium]
MRAHDQYQAALEAYQKSRALLPRASNTLNVGVCLFNLGRYDEAYEYFEEALTKFPEGQLSAGARDSAKASMATIETKVGRIDVSANVDGTLVIDGRMRGKIPLAAPIRTVPGKHVVRILRDGFETFEQTIDVRVGETTSVDAKLVALTSAGRLRVEASADLDGAVLSVDGAAVGALPWEGTLAPGTHVCMVAKGDVGAGPTLANVIVGQTVKIDVQGKPLGPERRIIVDPATADLSVDGVAVGKGRFQGRLTLGPHVLEAREPGYVNAKVSLDVSTADSSDFPVTLKVDEAHPRWRSNKPAGRFGVEVFGGLGFASSLGSDAAWSASPATGSITSFSQTAAPKGPRVGVTGTFELSNGIGVYVQVGWLSIERKLERDYAVSIVVPTATIDTTWNMQDDVQISGPFAAAGIGYRWKLTPQFDLAGRVLVSAGFVSAHDTVTGTASDGTRTLGATAIGTGVASSGLLLQAVPELFAGWSIGSFRISLGAAFPVSLTDGPAIDLKETIVSDPAQNAQLHKTSIDAVGSQAFAPGTKAFSSFVQIVPEAAVTMWF